MVGKKSKTGRNEKSNRDSMKKQGSDNMKGASFNARNIIAMDKAANLFQASRVRKVVDSDTAKYFNEIARIIEGTTINIEERAVICDNALEEARGKEIELATDYIISHTMQILLEGCSVDQLCDFLRNSAKHFSLIAMDRSGSHVAETALKSLAMHLQDINTRPLIEETLSVLCKEIVVHSTDIMCNCYGSHVLRRLLCFCRGISSDSMEFYCSKPSSAQTKNFIPSLSQSEDDELQQNRLFHDQMIFLISEMLNPSKVDVATLQLNQYSSLVLQTVLKLLAGNEQELLRIIPILLCCRVDTELEGTLIGMDGKQILYLLEENTYCHLMEVILAVAPIALYNQLISNIFKGSLFKMAAHPCMNFVLQALIAHAKNQDHMLLIWDELGAKFKNIFEMGRFGIVAALLSACQRLQIHAYKCCQALADSVHVADGTSGSIIPRILFVDNFFVSDDKSKWTWPHGGKMHILGSLILQSIFKFPSEHIQLYISDIISLEVNYILEASKDPTGNRVIEAFLNSNASVKQKRKLIRKLQGHFGELSVHPSGSFLVDKCFVASNISLREAIVSELLPVQMELSKTKQGPYLLRKLDVEGFAKRPDQWRSSQASKESTYKEFYEAFGPNETKSSRNNINFLADTSHKSQPESLKGMRNVIDTFLSSSSLLTHHHSTKPRKALNKRRVLETNGFMSERNKRHKIEK